MDSDRPNFVLIFPDQWRADCLGSLGHPVVETPWLDSLANAGVTFSSAYSPAPSCVPARASLITGQTPSTCGRPGMEEGVPWRYDPTLMRCLRDHGYQTMLAGKTHFYPQMTTCGFEKMLQYEAKVVGDAPECDYHAWLNRETAGRIQDTGSQIDRNTWVAHPWTHEERLHPNTWTMDAALELLEHRDPLRPFFLQVGFNRPHPPLDPPWHHFELFRDQDVPPPAIGAWAEDWRGRGMAPPPTPRQLRRTRQAYYAQIAHLDHQVGRLFHHLRQTGQFHNTYFIFSSDHGEMLGDHHCFGKRVPLEGSARVPLLVRSPRSDDDAARGTTCAAPCTLADIMPTVLEEAGVPIPATVEGASLAPWVRGETPAWREFVHGEHASAGEGWQFVTDGREKYFWESKSGREWFFDLAADPQELVDLASDPASQDRVERWRRRLIEVLAARPQDGLCDGDRLIPGKVLPCTRPELKAGN